MISFDDYIDDGLIKRFLDIDPEDVDDGWIGWARQRPYIFAPEMKTLARPLFPLDFARLVSNAHELRNEALKRSSNLYSSEAMTPEQLKYALGVALTESGMLRAVRLDKALLSVYAVNKELERRGISAVQPTLFVSAFNLRSCSKCFNPLDAARKEAVKKSLAQLLNQKEQFVSEFLKGNRVSIDVAVAAHEYLRGIKDFASIPEAIDRAITTPSEKFTKAAAGEDFSASRVTDLPSPLKRP